MSQFVVFLIFMSFIHQAYSDTPPAMESKPDVIDEKYDAISNTVIEWSDTIDKNLNKWISDSNFIEPKHEPGSDTEELQNDIDSFFQNQKYFEESSDAYVLIRFSSFFASKGDEKYKLKARAQIPLSRTRKKFKLFIEDLNKDNAKDILTKDNEEQETAPRIGIHYFPADKYDISSKYSLGLRGIYPYVRARYSKEFIAGDWSIEPVQSFKYSTKDKFEEKTDVYFDKQLNDKSLFRIQLNRKTETDTDGMDYFLGLSYYQLLKDDIGLSFSQIFWGNTKYTYTLDKNTRPYTQSKPYSGISNYVTSMSWRQNIWKKWFFFEVRPSVNFHRQNDYKANYSLNIDFEFYFGKYSGK